MHVVVVNHRMWQTCLQLNELQRESNTLRKFSDTERLRAHLALNQAFGRSFTDALAELAAKHDIPLERSTIQALVPACPEEIKSAPVDPLPLGSQP